MITVRLRILHVGLSHSQSQSVRIKGKVVRNIPADDGQSSFHQNGIIKIHSFISLSAIWTLRYDTMR